MKTWKSLSMVVLGVALLISGCASSSEKGDITSRKINVVTTIGMITDIVENVGGERIEVIGLMGAGIDPHLYKASEGDVSKMSNADIIFYNGLHLEAQMGEVFEQMGRQIKTVPVSENIDQSLLLASEDYEDAPDPHIWFNVEFWMQAVEVVRDTLSEMDPDSKKLYETNANAYLKQLEELHDYVQAQVQRVPKEQRVLITAHDAFRYFGVAYGFEVRGLQGISTESEAGTGDVQTLVGFIVERKINAIFVESSVPQRNIEAVQAAAEDKGQTVNIGGELFSDAMGDPGTEEGTYIGMVRHNIDTIVSALLNK
ncbi:MAG: zinc ABC transporter substrate-binding protein [Anaerolineae bacterium]|nr:zinc ABC transporter substrate-binding protein [Anaerolineae bacterium]